MKCRNSSLISVIMPAYNSAQYVAEAIESILSQTHHSWELIAIDDGSTDGTGQIIDAYAAKDFRIKVMHTANCGVSHARNLGLDMAKGDWIAFLDSDDKYTPDALEKLLASSDNCDMVKGSYQTFPESQGERRLPDFCYTTPDDVKPYLDQLWAGTFFYISCCTIYKKGLKARFDETQKYAEDGLFFIKNLKDCSRFRTISDCIYFYRRNVPDSLTHQPLNIDVAHCERFCRALRSYFHDDPALEDRWRKLFLHFIIKYLRAVWAESEWERRKKIKLIDQVRSNALFLKIPIQNYKLSAEAMRLFVILKTGDMALLEQEILEQEKRQKTENS